MSEIVDIQALLESLPPSQRECLHVRMLTKTQCACGASLSQQEFRALRRLRSDRLVQWEEPNPTAFQAQCEMYGHGKIESAGYAQVGEKKIPHRLGKCRICFLVRPRPQFKELHRRAAALTKRKASEAAECTEAAISHAGYMW